MIVLDYVYTNFGDVLSGVDYSEMNFRGHKILIQLSKLKEYQKLKTNEITLDKINEYGWALPKDAIVETFRSDVFNPPQEHKNGDSYSGSFDRSVMFIFGAGASANCVYGTEKPKFLKDELRPPLAVGLFEERFKKYYKNYGGVKQSLHQLQEDGVDVEEFFENEWLDVRNKNNQEVLSRHINIQYYLQEVLMDVSNRVANEYFSKNLYSSLANKLQKLHAASIKNEFGYRSFKKFGFISFNQDTIMEQFISEQFKRPLNAMSDYVNLNDHPFCIFKPHGSWNWGWKFPSTTLFGESTQEWLFNNNINFYQLYYQLLGDRINMVDWSIWGHEASINERGLGKHTIDKSQLRIMDKTDINSHYPAILLPYRDKDEFTMPLKHFLNMKIYLSQVKTLVIIGWKGNEAAFNRELINDGHQISKVIIADPNADLVIKNLTPLLKMKNIIPIIYDDFEHFVREGVEKELGV